MLFHGLRMATGYASVEQMTCHKGSHDRLFLSQSWPLLIRWSLGLCCVLEYRRLFWVLYLEFVFSFPRYRFRFRTLSLVANGLIGLWKSPMRGSRLSGDENTKNPKPSHHTWQWPWAGGYPRLVLMSSYELIEPWSCDLAKSPRAAR